MFAWFCAILTAASEMHLKGLFDPVRSESVIVVYLDVSIARLHFLFVTPPRDD